MKRIILLVAMHLFVVSLHAHVNFAKIFSDNMVLQAHRPVKIWGNAAPGETVKVFLNERQKTTLTDKTGRWIVEFPPLDYSDAITLKAVGKENEVELRNILIGEVWICSGQSNMAMTVNGAGGKVYNYKNEESSANYPNIRMFNVKPNLSASVGNDIDGKWSICSPETVSDFSAVAYFFARKIYQETRIPIGIINSSWGGTDIETWISMDAFKRLPDRFKSRYKDAETYGVDAALKKNEDNRNSFFEAVANDVGMEEQWYRPSYNSELWKQMFQPQEWSNTELASFDGVAWFRYEFYMSDMDAGESGILSLGKVDDNDITWINGIKIGETEGAGYDRIYEIPSGVLLAR